MTATPDDLRRATALPEGVRPIAVDPEILRRIRPMQRRDARRVAELHHQAMGNSLWARLGPPFLQGLYQGLVDSQHFLAFVYEEGGRVKGFIAGSTCTAIMYREVMAAHWPRLILASARGVLADLRLAPSLLQTARYFDASGDQVAAESLFCSFEPELRGTGVSNHINKVLFDDFRARGHDRVKITTETDNLGANRQLTRWGFVVDRRFRFYGKQMVSYVLDLTASPRVDPVSRHPTL